MGTTAEFDKGIMPSAVNEIFSLRDEKLSQNKDTFVSMKIELSYLEIYLEDCYDLLSKEALLTSASASVASHEKKLLTVRGTNNGETYCEGLTILPINNINDVITLLNIANKARSTGKTAMNHSSSRSHAICILTLTTTKTDGSIVVSKLNLVDLAGSERAKKTQATGEAFQEGISINKGLLALGNVVAALSQRSAGKQNPPPSGKLLLSFFSDSLLNYRLCLVVDSTGSNAPPTPSNSANNNASSSSSSNHIHIPYRESKLTRLLKDSLGGNGVTVLLACLSPAPTNYDESLNTLRFASRASSIINSAKINLKEQQAQLQQQQQYTSVMKERNQLKDELTMLQEKYNQLLLSSLEKSQKEKKEEALVLSSVAASSSSGGMILSSSQQDALLNYYSSLSKYNSSLKDILMYCFSEDLVIEPDQLLTLSNELTDIRNLLSIDYQKENIQKRLYSSISSASSSSSSGSSSLPSSTELDDTIAEEERKLCEELFDNIDFNLPNILSLIDELKFNEMYFEENTMKLLEKVGIDKKDKETKQQQSQQSLKNGKRMISNGSTGSSSSCSSGSSSLGTMNEIEELEDHQDASFSSLNISQVDICNVSQLFINNSFDISYDDPCGSSNGGGMEGIASGKSSNSGNGGFGEEKDGQQRSKKSQSQQSSSSSSSSSKPSGKAAIVPLQKELKTKTSQLEEKNKLLKKKEKEVSKVSTINDSLAKKMETMSEKLLHYKQTQVTMMKKLHEKEITLQTKTKEYKTTENTLTKQLSFKNHNIQQLTSRLEKKEKLFHNQLTSKEKEMNWLKDLLLLRRQKVGNPSSSNAASSSSTATSSSSSHGTGNRGGNNGSHALNKNNKPSSFSSKQLLSHLQEGINNEKDKISSKSLLSYHLEKKILLQKQKTHLENLLKEMILNKEKKNTRNMMKKQFFLQQKIQTMSNSIKEKQEIIKSLQYRSSSSSFSSSSASNAIASLIHPLMDPSPTSFSSSFASMKLLIQRLYSLLLQQLTEKEKINLQLKDYHMKEEQTKKAFFSTVSSATVDLSLLYPIDEIANLDELDKVFALYSRGRNSYDSADGGDSYDDYSDYDDNDDGEGDTMDVEDIPEEAVRNKVNDSFQDETFYPSEEEKGSDDDSYNEGDDDDDDDYKRKKTKKQPVQTKKIKANLPKKSVAKLRNEEENSESDEDQNFRDVNDSSDLNSSNDGNKKKSRKNKKAETKQRGSDASNSSSNSSGKGRKRKSVETAMGNDISFDGQLLVNTSDEGFLPSQPKSKKSKTSTSSASSRGSSIDNTHSEEYNKWNKFTIKQLKGELAERHLPVSGTFSLCLFVFLSYFSLILSVSRC
jgi:hypothetical protein